MLGIIYAVIVGLTVAESLTKEEQNCTVPLELCYVLDSSKSVCASDPTYNAATDSTCNNWIQMIDFLYNATLKMDIGEYATRIAVVVFGSKAYIRWRLTKYSDKPSLLTAIRSLQYIAGTTNTSGALDVVRGQIFGTDVRENATKLAFILTDGKANNQSAVQKSVEKLHADGVLTISVGITNSIDQKAMKQLASDPKKQNETYFPVIDFEILYGILPSVSRVICKYLPAIASNYTPACKNKIDLAVVLDSSESICHSDPTYKKTEEGCDNWKAMLSFVHETTDRLAIDPDNTRVAVITFSTKATIRFKFYSYQDSFSLGEAIDELKYTAGTTNTSGALDVMNLKLFANGARPDAAKICVFITDGKSTDPRPVQAAINRVHAANIRTFVIGVTGQANEDSLKQLSSEPKLINQNYFRAIDFEAFDTINKALQTQICNAASATATPRISTTTATTTTSTPSTTTTTAAKAQKDTPFI